jgi:multidrug efflux system outer membrane protein
MRRFQPLPAGLAMSVVLALAGCASGPQAGPGTRVPDVLPAGAQAWQASLPPASAGATTTLSSFWGGFNDPLLLPLVDAAQRANPGLAQATARIAHARAARVAAGAALQAATGGRGQCQPRHAARPGLAPP